MSGRRSELVDIAQQDDRYAVEAYEFLCHALAYTQRMLGKVSRPAGEAAEPETQSNHVSGQQLLEGVRHYALEQFGMMAPVVFRLWGIQNTRDFGAMVYTLIEAGHWHKSDDDRLEDFDDLYDFDEVFVREYKIEWDEL
ncbi:hypothetical protein Pan216_20200 [Planctomycetes bacterium Pan216]|uniref:Uncharacterized protein n=1 Tax=Kolteria novifilia TaxID=2527975 RepID=A0A518B2L0_9BACT|nr:hypothetical protein Pan216_20200 [Planctomycetes bacterium Pan216]